MNNDDECEVCFPWWGTVFFCVLVFVFTWLLTFGITDRRWQVDAVKNGHARWVIKDVESGHAEWEWLPGNPPGGR